MYNYCEVVEHDVKNWMEENEDMWKGEDRCTVEQIVYDACWAEDSVTGNASGSYTFSRYDAKRHFFEDENAEEYFSEAIRDFGITVDELADVFKDSNWEWVDVTIRCYLLNNAVSNVLDEMNI